MRIIKNNDQSTDSTRRIKCKICWRLTPTPSGQCTSKGLRLCTTRMSNIHSCVRPNKDKYKNRMNTGAHKHNTMPAQCQHKPTRPMHQLPRSSQRTIKSKQQRHAEKRPSANWPRRKQTCRAPADRQPPKEIKVLDTNKMR